MQKVFLFLLLIGIAFVHAQQEIEEFLILEEETLAKKVKITVDKKNSNDWFIQVTAKPKNKVHSIQFIAPDGSSTMLYPPSWEKHHATFAGKPAAAVPLGSKVTLKLWYIGSGSQVVKLKYGSGSGGNSGGNGGGNGGNSSDEPTQEPEKPSSKNAAIQKLIKQVKSFNQPGDTPTAYVSNEDSLREKNKKVLAKTLAAMKINDAKTKSFLYALFTLESEQMYDSNGEAQRDTSKDDKPLWKNVSPLNMNVDMLNIIKFKGNPDSLNKIKYIKLVDIHI